MILSSYKTNFDNILDYYLFNIAKKLNKFPMFQIRALEMLLKVRKNKKLYALYLYLCGVNNVDRSLYKPLIEVVLNYADDFNASLDFVDLHLKNSLLKVARLPKDSTNPKNINFGSNIIYVFDKSGFFSTIITLMNVNFFCQKHNITINFDSRNWPYPFDLSLIFPNMRKSESENSYSGQDELFLKSRAFVDQIQKVNHDIYTEYSNYRCNVIKKIFDTCNLYLNQEVLKELNERSNFTTCFVRRGDKLKYESYALTISNYVKALESYDRLLIIGDDYFFNYQIVKRSKFKFTQWCLKNYRIKGGYISNTSSNALTSILSNFYLLCIADEIIGDANCNLVAAAMIYRGDFYTDCLKLHPWRLKNYI